jgi:hypothetical protein
LGQQLVLEALRRQRMELLLEQMLLEQRCCHSCCNRNRNLNHKPLYRSKRCSCGT